LSRADRAELRRSGKCRVDERQALVKRVVADHSNGREKRRRRDFRERAAARKRDLRHRPVVSK
jgi:hypothetical protein